MMGFVQAFSACVNCHQSFFYNPERVPSVRVDGAGRPSEDGTREPVCLDCMERLNAKRRAAGLDPFPILPGAYDAEEV